MSNDVLLLILAMSLCITGLAGCILPGLPGPPFNYAGMVLVQYVHQSFEAYTLIIFGVLTASVLILDYLIPAWFAKKFGATKQGIWGSIIGMFVGMFFTPIGMVLGLLFGAIIGDLLAGRSPGQASRSGLGTFLGTLFSVGIKLGLAGIITGLVFYECIRILF